MTTSPQASKAQSQRESNSKVKNKPMFHCSTFVIASVCFLTLLLLRPPKLHITYTTVQVPSPTATAPSCITMVGDTMIQNGSKNFASNLEHPRDAFGHVQLLLNKCPYVVANLEGPITTLGLKHSPNRHAQPAYSFNMDPSSCLEIFRQVGITHFGRSNNHLRDRGERGVEDTHYFLKQANVPHFGSGKTKPQAATPVILDMHTFKVGITAFSNQFKVIAGENENETGVLPVTEEHAALGKELLDQHDSQVTTRIAYVHWGKNYGQVSDTMRQHAKILAEHGYDLIVGSDGSHTVQPFEYVSHVPVLYNVGNFVFQTPGRYRGMDEYMPYGSVLNVNLDSSTGKPSSLDLYCTVIDNKVVEYQPQLCTPSQARKLFKSLGEHVEHTEGTVYGTVNLIMKDEKK